MILAQLTQKGLVLVIHQIVKSDTRADKHLFNLWQCTKLSKQLYIVAVVNNQVGTRLRKQALLCRACSPCELLFTCRLSEIGCRSSNIMDITLKILILRDKLCLVNNRLMASCLDYPALMEGQCTEITASKAASVADERKLHLAYRRHSACLLVARMICPHIRQCIYLIHLLLRQWLLRWILHHKRRVVIWLYKPLCTERIGIAVLYVKASRKLSLVLFYDIVIWKLNSIIYDIPVLSLEHCAIYKCNILYIHAAIKRIRNLNDASFAHAI